MEEAGNKVKSVVIVGAGGFGREVLEIFKDHNRVSKTWNILGFIDENKELHGKMVNGYLVLGGLDWKVQPPDTLMEVVTKTPNSVL